MSFQNYYLSAYNGVTIPQLGFGVYKLTNKSEFKTALTTAIEVGYRHFDTAMIYRNEQELGDIIKKSGLPRSDFFITSKVWNTDHGYEETKKAFVKTCEKLQTDYLDMYLIHWASPKYLETWRAMEELYNEGKIKIIGVSNFQIHHLEDLISHSKIVPMVNQIETHPDFSQTELHKYQNEHQILHEAWGPLGQANKQLLTNEKLVEIANNHNKSVAQIILRWHLQRGIIIIPKSATPKRIAENANIFDFTLEEAEMNIINSLNSNTRHSLNPDGYIINPIYNKLMKLFLK